MAGRYFPSMVGRLSSPAPAVGCAEGIGIGYAVVRPAEDETSMVEVEGMRRNVPFDQPDQSGPGKAASKITAEAL